MVEVSTIHKSTIFFLRQQRSAWDLVPVIILTAQDQISERIAGGRFGIGTDI